MPGCLRASVLGALIDCFKKLFFPAIIVTRAKNFNNAEFSKIPININGVDIDIIFISEKFECSENGRKYFMGCKHNENNLFLVF